MAFFNYNGKRLYYKIKEAKSKNFLIFLHGSGGDSTTWRFQFDIDNNYSIIALDLPSHGKSDKFKNLSLNLYVDVLRRLIKSLKYEKIVLCGHSLGGTVIQTYYFLYPEDITALILISTGAKLRVSPVILEFLKKDYEDYLNYLNNVAFYKNTSKEIIDRYKNQSSLVGAEVTYYDFKICNEFNLFEKIKLIKAPCLIISGTEDKLTPIKYSQYFHNNIAKSEMILIEEAGHMVMLEKYEKVNESIIDFTKRLN